MAARAILKNFVTEYNIENEIDKRQYIEVVNNILKYI